MDKLQWKELILQWVKGHEFVFIVSIEGVADDNDFILSLSKDDVLSLVIDRFKDTDIFEGVMNVPYNIDSEINSNLALLAGKYPGKYLEITLSTLENYLKSWKYLYENFDEEFFEDMRHCYYKYFHDSDYCYYELADLEGEFDIWPVVEGEGTVREIQYYVVDCLVALRLHVYDDMLLVHVGEHNLDGGVARKIEVKDMAKLKSILGVNNIEDVIDALMGKCQSIDSPLDKDMFYQFLKENGLEYDEQVKGEYVSYMDADENLYSVCRPIDSSIEQDSKDESVLEDEINTSLLTLPIVSYQEDTLRFVVRTPEGTEAIVPAVLFQQTQEFVNNLPESLECYVMKDGSIQQAKKQLLEQCFKKKKGHATFIVDTITDNKYQLLDFYGFSHPYESDISHQWKIGEEVEMIYDGIEACDEDNTAWLKIVEPYVLEVAIRTNAQMAYNDESLQLPLNLNAETYSPYYGLLDKLTVPRLNIREGLKVEFKASLVYTQQGVLNIDCQMVEIMQAIAAFMNADGGKLYIGVRDNGEVRGIEPDLPYIQTSKHDPKHYSSTFDGLKQKIYSSLIWHLGQTSLEYIGPTIQFTRPRGYRNVEVHYVVLTVLPADEIIWCYPKIQGQDGELYVRRDGNVQKYPPGDALVRFIVNRTQKIRQRV